jgi:CRISPR-associated protein Csm4
MHFAEVGASMSYQLYRVKMRPDSAFVTAFAADTLFGHVCWSIRHQFGETKLNELLTGTTLKINHF